MTTLISRHPNPLRTPPCRYRECLYQDVSSSPLRHQGGAGLTLGAGSRQAKSGGHDCADVCRHCLRPPIDGRADWGQGFGSWARAYCFVESTADLLAGCT